ncbi:hypothetical protein AMATHDRAFT_9617 [Amanita thiersii Skay4041]|uniref:Uncharacterized protein n=1 Tax=Amanita thiersii Skay4041 TaxID=703135 RepID=A0A2A9NCC2_9AGAR|nr:hypothetical protein AMATHDRAFT_9617 [Amanita thiersii Skay4041]
MVHLGLQPGTKGWSFLQSNGAVFIGTKAIFDESWFPRGKDTAVTRLPPTPTSMLSSSESSDSSDDSDSDSDQGLLSDNDNHHQTTHMGLNSNSDDNTEDDHPVDNKQQEPGPHTNDPPLDNHEQNDDHPSEPPLSEELEQMINQRKQHMNNALCWPQGPLYEDPPNPFDYQSSDQESFFSPPPRRLTRNKKIPIRPGNIYGELLCPQDL